MTGALRPFLAFYGVVVSLVEVLEISDRRTTTMLACMQRRVVRLPAPPYSGPP